MKQSTNSDLFQNNNTLIDVDSVIKLKISLKGPSFPKNRHTIGDFSKNTIPEKKEFVPIFKRLSFNNLIVQESKDEILKDFSDINLNNNTISQNTINEFNVESQNFIKNSVEEIIKNDSTVQEMVLNQLEVSNNYSSTQIQEFEKNYKIDNKYYSEITNKMFENLENTIININQENKKEAHNIRKEVKKIEDFLSS